MIPREDITGLILAGGLGRRMSSDGRGANKALQPLRGRPLIAHVIQRLAPQVGSLLLNVNQQPEAFARFGLPMVADQITGFAGPLAGMHAGLGMATTPWVLTCPCDTPFLPDDLGTRLAEALDRGDHDLAVARTGAQPHPVFALMARHLHDDLTQWLAQGGRKIDAWYARLRVVEVDFIDPAPFLNINTPDELAQQQAASSPSDSDGLARMIGRLNAYDPDALPVPLAQEIISGAIEPVAASESVAIRDALDRILTADLLSPIDVPAHDNSAMDGFAVRSADLRADQAVTLHLVGRAMAGQPWNGTLGPGQCARVMTGAVMPGGSDTVVPQELVQADGDHILIPAGQQPGQHRRHQGEDLSAGKPALWAGRRLGPADLGLIASLGIAEVTVRRRLRVAFFSTGDELRSIGQPLAPGQIYDSNRYTIDAMLRRLGIDRLDMGVVPDQPEALEQAVRIASRSADAIISSGGVSVGEADFTKSIMARLGDVRFWTIAMRPGRPMAFGRIGDAWYFGLPGNPVAVMVTFYFFARLGLRRLAGASATADPLLSARSASDIRKRAGRTEYQRGILRRADDGVMTVGLTGQQGSGVLSSMSQANCMIVLHHDQGPVRAGDPVDCIPFDGLI